MKSLVNSLKITLGIAAIFWLVRIFEQVTTISLSSLGVYPREIHGLWGILFSPFLHGDLVHLTSNTVPFIVLGTTILYFYPRIAAKAMLLIYLLTGLGVWLLARSSYHIGASGVVYGFFAFLFFFGLFRKDFKSLTITVVVAFLYGGLIYGVLPMQVGVSWESHLIGGIVGGMTAYAFRNVRAVDYVEKEPFKKYDFNGAREGYRNMESDNFKYTYRDK